MTSWITIQSYLCFSVFKLQLINHQCRIYIQKRNQQQNSCASYTNNFFLISQTSNRNPRKPIQRLIATVCPRANITKDNSGAPHTPGGIILYIRAHNESSLARLLIIILAQTRKVRTHLCIWPAHVLFYSDKRSSTGDNVYRLCVLVQFLFAIPFSAKVYETIYFFNWIKYKSASFIMIKWHPKTKV